MPLNNADVGPGGLHNAFVISPSERCYIGRRGARRQARSAFTTRAARTVMPLHLIDAWATSATDADTLHRPSGAATGLQDAEADI